MVLLFCSLFRASSLQRTFVSLRPGQLLQPAWQPGQAAALCTPENIAGTTCQAMRFAVFCVRIRLKVWPLASRSMHQQHITYWCMCKGMQLVSSTVLGRLVARRVNLPRHGVLHPWSMHSVSAACWQLFCCQYPCSNANAGISGCCCMWRTVQLLLVPSCCSSTSTASHVSSAPGSGNARASGVLPCCKHTAQTPCVAVQVKYCSGLACLVC